MRRVATHATRLRPDSIARLCNQPGFLLSHFA
jgi:hypothetical protein